MKRNTILPILFSFLIAYGISCTTSLPPSPEPGVIHLYITTDSEDRDTLGITEGDALILRLSNIRVFRDTLDYAVIYDTLGAYEEKERIVNAFRVKGDSFAITRIGETWLPPEEFVQIRITVHPGQVVDTTITIDTTVVVDTTVTPPETTTVVDTSMTMVGSNVLILGGIRYPVHMPDTVDPVVSLDYTFSIVEHETTDVVVVFEASKSIRRRWDAYEFYPTFRVK